MASVQLVIVNRICQGLQSALNMTPQQVYPIIQRHYVEGFGQRAIQVVPGPERPSGNGDGGQTGGMIEIEQLFTLWVWYRFKGDMHNMSQDLITLETQGFADFIDTVRQTFTYTYLGTVDLTSNTTNLLLEPMKYRGATETSWQDEKKGVAYRGITFSATYAQIWPNVPSLDNSNFTFVS